MKNMERLSAAALAALAWTGLLIQFWLLIRMSAVNGRGIVWGFIAYTGFFTILTNGFVALVATMPLVVPRSRTGRWFARPAVRGCAVMAIAGVGIAYHLLLRHVWNPQGWQWIADILLHYAVPVGALVWWIAFPPEEVSWKWPLLWCAWPVGYFIYALVRAEFVHSYPYYFFDVVKLGWPAVLRNAGGLALFFPVLGCAVTGLGAARRRFTRRP